MFVYQVFKQDYVGTQKNSWTFIELKRECGPKGFEYYVICKCQCGSIALYSPGFCMGPNLPEACRKCSRGKKKSQWLPELLIDKELALDYKFNSDLEIVDIVHDYEDYYRKHYRD